jgi:hypothetical protein
MSGAAVAARWLAAGAALTLGLIATSCGSGETAAPASTTAAAQPSGASDIGAGLRGPVGLRATTIASGLTHVSAFAFDPGGRLWIATASIDDDGTDGVYLIAEAGATPTKMISDVHTPLGLLWIGDELFVSENSRVVAHSGLDAGSFATRRTVVQFAAGVGELNGLALAPSGRIVLGISSPCNACVVTDGYSASVVSFQPDGSNPVLVGTDGELYVGDWSTGIVYRIGSTAGTSAVASSSAG